MSAELEQINGTNLPAHWIAPEGLQRRYNATTQPQRPVPAHVWLATFGALTLGLTAVGCLALLLGAFSIGVIVGAAAVLALAIVGGLIVERREGRPFGAQR